MVIIRRAFFIIIGLFPLFTYSQNTINLIDLYKAVDINNPLAKIPSGIDSIYQLKSSNIRTSYLPKLDLNASATWQSEVTSINLPSTLPFSIPETDKDQYKVSFDVSQLIWDGGTTRAREKMEDLNKVLEQNKVNIEIYNVKDRITNLYFNLLLIKVTEDQLYLMSNELDKRIAELESGVKAGYILSSTLVVIKAEKLKILQNIDAIPTQRKSLISSLKSLTGIPLNDNDTYLIPNPDTLNSLNCLRPEYNGFRMQQDALTASSNLIARKRYPVLAGFASAGYGKPGLNMMSNEWNTYYMFGAKLSWNIWDWNSVHKEKQQLKLQANTVGLRERSYLDSYQAQVDGILLEIQKLKNQLSKDKEIVQLLHKVSETSASSLKNGSITSSVYISDFDSESRAQLEMEIRRIRLSLQRVMLYNLTGNELK